ncbi:MAG TPA: glycerate kinase, partial [Candidatus Binatia bacterium]|nr:glycerate kinase [Candidatus Binatia bacterium]
MGTAETTARAGRDAERRTDGGGRARRSLGVLFAPDSFKGSLSSVEVARALATGWGRARPDDRLHLAPLADGGEGTLAAIEVAGGWSWRTTPVADPLGRIVEARWLLQAGAGGSAADRRAVIELAEASGLSRLAPDERDPLRASTVGTGQLLLAALEAGVRRIVLGIGGSATTDGGAGMLVALGGQLIDHAGRPLAPDGRPGDGGRPADGGRPSDGGRPADGGWPAVMAALDRIDLSGLDPRLADVELAVASDVTNPLLGPTGAAATYGPQKGATPADVAALDAALARWADCLEAATGRRERETPGAGAAGGVGFALLCLRDRVRRLEFRPGIELVMAETGFDARLEGADLVVTGEGRIDAQTAFGKTAMGVARRARAAGRPVVAVGGGVTIEGVEVLGEAGVVVVPVV